MDEQTIRGLMITVVYPAMIALAAGLFTLLQIKLQKDNSPKRVELKSRK